MEVTMLLTRKIFIHGFIIIATICCHSVAAMENNQLLPQIQQQSMQAVCPYNPAQQFQRHQMCPINQRNYFQCEQAQEQELSQLQVVEQQIEQIAKNFGNKAANLIFLQKILNNKKLQQELKQKGYGIQVPSVAPISHEEICDLLMSLKFDFQSEWSRLIFSLTHNQINKAKETKKLSEEFIVKTKILSEEIRDVFNKAAEDIENARTKEKSFWKRHGGHS